MADPLSIAASLAGLITLGAQLGKYILQTYNKLNDAPSSLLHINAELGALSSILDRLRAFAESQKDAETYSSEIRDAIFGKELMNMVVDCTRIMQELEQLVRRVDGSPKGNQKRLFWRNVKWTTLDGDVSRLRSQIDTHKATFTLALNLAARHDAAMAQKMTQRIDARTADMEAQLLEMRGFLERLHVTPQISNVPGAENFEDPTTKVLEAYIESVHSVIESSVRGEGSVLSLGDAATVADTGPESAETAITEPDSSAEDLGMEELDRWLGSVEYRNSYTAFVRRRFADSNLWIFEQTATKHWFGLRPGYSLLWINGVAGTGKSVLLSSIIEQAQTQTNATTAYFFFDHDDPNTNNALGCLKALVKQILEQNMDLTPMAKPYLYGYGSGSFDMYKALLFNILGSIGIVYLVIDGIDECNSEDKGNFLKLLIELQRLNIRTCRVCVSSRMESVIADQLNQEATAIELKGTLIDAPYLFAQRTVSQIFQRRNYGTAIGEAIRDMLDSENEKRCSKEEMSDIVRLKIKGIYILTDAKNFPEFTPEAALELLIHRWNPGSFPKIVEGSFFRDLYEYGELPDDRERAKAVISALFKDGGVVPIDQLAAACGFTEEEVERIIIAFPSIVLIDKYRTVKCRSPGILKCMHNLLFMTEAGISRIDPSANGEDARLTTFRRRRGISG